MTIDRSHGSGLLPDFFTLFLKNFLPILYQKKLNPKIQKLFMGAGIANGESPPYHQTCFYTMPLQQFYSSSAAKPFTYSSHANCMPSFLSFMIFPTWNSKITITYACLWRTVFHQ